MLVKADISDRRGAISCALLNLPLITAAVLPYESISQTLTYCQM